MPKIEKKAMDLFGRSSKGTNFVEAFESLEAVTANFRNEFVATPLSTEEEMNIQNLLYENYVSNKSGSDEVDADYKTLVLLTRQIKSIDRQGILLHGERIHKARGLLKKYRDGTFTKWLIKAYGNRQTPYRMLHFYELFQELEGEDRKLLEKMPKKVAYQLAMRDGSLMDKAMVIRNHQSKSPEEISEEIQKVFPLQKEDRRIDHSNKDDRIVKTLENAVAKLMQKKSLSNCIRKKLEKLIENMQKILSLD
ncbi:MAG: CT583 family protein [Candidatus Rhabdochlamydia sp.]|jgi:hypothetical protein